MGRIFCSLFYRGLFIGIFCFIHLFAGAKNYDAELVSYETVVVVNNGKLTKSISYQIQINNRQGEEYTEVSIPYSKLLKVSKISAFVKDLQGNVLRKLKKSDLSDRSAISDFSFYEDDFVKEFTLRHNNYPYILEYSYETQQDEFFYIDFWTPLMDLQIPVQRATLQVEIPLDYKIAYNDQGIDHFRCDTLEQFVRYYWEAKYTNVIEPEVKAPSRYSYLPFVSIVPEEFKFEKKGSFASWVTYGNWQNKLLAGASELTETEKSRITKLISGIGDKREKLKILYHYLQDETRYLNVTIETGGLKPYPASYVSENKYGDCKALTNYMKSLLDFVGIQSYYTNVYGGNPSKKVLPEFPSQQFNHVILMVPFEADTVWLDCTSKGPFNYLGTFTQNRPALVIDANHSHLLRTPKLSPSQVLEQRKIIIESEAGRTAKVTFQEELRGEAFELLLGIKNAFNDTDRKRILQKYIVEKGCELVDFTIGNHQRDEQEINIEYVATTPKIYRLYGNDLVVKNVGFSLPEFEKIADRKLPVQLDYPISKSDTLIYQIPTGFKLDNHIGDQHIRTRFGEYQLKVETKEETISVVKNISVYAGNYTLEDYPEFYRFFDKISNMEDGALITLTK